MRNTLNYLDPVSHFRIKPSCLVSYSSAVPGGSKHSMNIWISVTLKQIFAPVLYNYIFKIVSHLTKMDVIFKHNILDILKYYLYCLVIKQKIHSENIFWGWEGGFIILPTSDLFQNWIYIQSVSNILNSSWVAEATRNRVVYTFWPLIRSEDLTTYF